MISCKLVVIKHGKRLAEAPSLQFNCTVDMTNKEQGGVKTDGPKHQKESIADARIVPKKEGLAA